MKKLNREEVFMYVEKIRKGLGSDDEVTRWVEVFKRIGSEFLSKYM
jgi:hypothetical protein